MAFHTYIGAGSGVYRLDQDGLTPLGLEGQRVWAIHAFESGNGHDTVLAGTYGDGIFRSTDSGQSWQPANEGLTATALRTIQPDPTQAGALICGAEPARAFRSTDGGQSWDELSAITEIDSCPDWYLPYSPRAGAIRNFYSPPGNGGRLLGSIEVGGLLDSPDSGETWSLLDIPPDDDIHHITGHPDNGDVLFAALGWASLRRDRPREEEPRLGGVSRSDDGGKSWRKFYSDYTRAVIVPPGDHNLLLAAPAKRVGAEGRIEVSSDGGESWEAAGAGLDTPMYDMVELFVPAPDGTIWAICSQGRLLQAEPGEWHWRSALPEDAEISAESVSCVG